MILDSSALLAFLFGEPGGLTVRPLIRISSMSAVNVTEVITKMMKKGFQVDDVMAVIDSLNLEILAWDHASMHAAAELSSLAWTHGLSLGDRACLATARLTGQPVLTAERHWNQLPDLGISIQCIR